MKLEGKLTVIKRVLVAYLAVVTYVIVPLYMKRGYFGLIEAKAWIYRCFAVPAAVAAILILAAHLYLPDEKGGSPGKKPAVSSVLLLLIGAWSLISSGLSYDFRLSFMGNYGWSVGSLMTCLLIIGTIYIARNLVYENNIILLMMAVNAFVIMLAVVQSAGLDPFGLLKDLINKEYYNYLSTIGNLNSFCGYLCLILPLFWGGFMSCRERTSKILYGAISATGFLGIILTNSDSIYAGIGICLIFMVPFVLGSEQHVKRAGILMSMFGCCLLIVRFVPVFADKARVLNGISKVMVKPPVAVILCLIGILAFCRGWRLIGGRWNKTALIVLETALFLAIIGFVLHSVMHFDDSWGSGRGAIWRTEWESFSQFSFRNKMVGVGPEMLFIVFAKFKVDTGRNVLSAHCEPMQVLLTQGITGLCLYISFWGYMLRLFFKNRLWRKSAAVFFFPLAAYWGQSLFCSVYPVTAVLFSFAAGMYLRAAEAEG